MRVEIPTTYGGTLPIEFEPGKPLVILGANGTGKSRLGIYIDDHRGSGPSHRIAAQRSLELPEEILSEKYDSALRQLLRDKDAKRPAEQAAGMISYKYDELLITLFAERHRELERTLVASRGRATMPRPETLIEKLQDLWREFLPHRELVFAEGSVKTIPTGRPDASYEGSQMSDGERVILYVIGHALLVPQAGVLIVDEPELHINRAVMVRLWDAIEAARDDCAFVYVTHDIDFATSRRAAVRLNVLGYEPPVRSVTGTGRGKRSTETQPPRWDVQVMPVDADLPDEVLNRIAGSRQPILFVEGTSGSLDPIVFRQVYAGFMVIPAESCARVIQFVKSFQSQGSLHRVRCAGLVDRDGRRTDESGLVEEAIFALPVSELENLFLLPNVFLALAEVLAFPMQRSGAALEELIGKVLEKALENVDTASVRYASRRIYETGRALGVKARSIDELEAKFEEAVAQIQPRAVHDAYKEELRLAIDRRDYEAVLRLYDNKGLLALIPPILGLRNREALDDLICRLLPTKSGARLLAALRAALPKIPTGS